MIIDPDFLDHWRTRMLVDALDGDEMAPLYLMRIWAHCQSRRATTFNMPAFGLKALCRFPGDAAKLEQVLVEGEFIERDGESISVPKWAGHNAKLIANWDNGGKGGRPIKEPTDNPEETHAKPTSNPTVTESEPTGTQVEPTETQGKPIREDRIREEKTGDEGKKKKTITAAPVGGFAVSGPMREWATANVPSVNVDRETLQFVDHHTARGSTFKDWPAAWRTWMRNAVKFSSNGKKSPQASDEPYKPQNDFEKQYPRETHPHMYPPEGK